MKIVCQSTTQENKTYIIQNKISDYSQQILLDAIVHYLDNLDLKNITYLWADIHKKLWISKNHCRTKNTQRMRTFCESTFIHLFTAKFLALRVSQKRRYPVTVVSGCIKMNLQTPHVRTLGSTSVCWNFYLHIRDKWLLYTRSVKMNAKMINAPPRRAALIEDWNDVLMPLVQSLNYYASFRIDFGIKQASTLICSWNIGKAWKRCIFINIFYLIQY